MTSDRDLIAENRRALQGADDARAAPRDVRGQPAGAAPAAPQATPVRSEAGTDYGDFRGVHRFPQPQVGPLPVVPAERLQAASFDPAAAPNGMPPDPSSPAEPLVLPERLYHGYEVRTDTQAVPGGVKAVYLIRRANTDNAPFDAQALDGLYDSTEAAQAAALAEGCRAVDRLVGGG